MHFATVAKTLLLAVAAPALAQTTNSDGQAICGSQIYTVGQFTCFRTPSGASYACPIVGNNAYQLCGENLCYNAANYRCTGGVLVAATGTASTVSTTNTVSTQQASAVTAPVQGATSVNNVSAASSQSVRASASASRAASSSAAAASTSARSDATTLQGYGSIAAAVLLAAAGMIVL